MGLGSENKDLPDFLVSAFEDAAPDRSASLRSLLGEWLSSHPAIRESSCATQGIPCSISRIQNGLPRHLRRSMLDGLSELNSMRLAETGDPEIATRIRQYEMAYRMQSSIPGLTDLSDEPESTFELYGPDSRRPGKLRCKLYSCPPTWRNVMCGLLNCFILTGTIIVA